MSDLPSPEQLIAPSNPDDFNIWMDDVVWPLIDLARSGRLVDRKAIDYGNADSEIADQTDEIQQGDRKVYDPVHIVDAAIGDTDE